MERERMEREQKQRKSPEIKKMVIHQRNRKKGLYGLRIGDS